MTWLRRLARRMRRAAYRGRHARMRTDPFRDMAMRLPFTLPPPPADLGPWPPRIARWVRVACPQPDDTMLLPPGTAAMVTELMARDFTWDP